MPRMPSRPTVELAGSIGRHEAKTLRLEYAAWAIWANAGGAILGVAVVVAAVVFFEWSAPAGAAAGVVVALAGLGIAGVSLIPLMDWVRGGSPLVINEHGLCYGDTLRPVVAWHEITRVRTVVDRSSGLADHRFLIDVRDLAAVKRRASPMLRLRMLVSRAAMGSAIAISMLGSSTKPAEVGAIIARYYRGEWDVD